MKNPAKVFITSDLAKSEPRLSLGNEHDFFTVPSFPAEGLALISGQYGIELVNLANQEKLHIDFTAAKSRHRRLRGGGELLVRALGHSLRFQPAVADVTAGLGRDAFVIASAGMNVVLFERSRVLALMLDDALSRCRENGDADEREISTRMRLVSGDAKQTLSAVKPDVVYMDPMFPHRRKSALVKKELRLLQQLLGSVDEQERESSELLDIAMQEAKYRVVVKRPLKASVLNGAGASQLKPAFQLKGKAIRFDVYTKCALPAVNRS